MRVTGGTLRSRQLVCPRGDRTRPTSDRVREALFSILGHRGKVAGARVLDLYAGSGALAVEALSRGAAHAVLVEADRAALGAIGRNLEDLELARRASVIADTVERAAVGSRRGARSPLAAIAGEGFTLVLADPPYAEVGAAGAVLGRLVELLAAGACVVLEHATRDAPPDIAGLARGDTRTWGDTSVSFYGQAGL